MCTKFYFQMSMVVEIKPILTYSIIPNASFVAYFLPSAIFKQVGIGPEKLLWERSIMLIDFSLVGIKSSSSVCLKRKRLIFVMKLI